MYYSPSRVQPGHVQIASPEVVLVGSVGRWLLVGRLKHFMVVCKPWLAGIVDILQWRKPKCSISDSRAACCYRVVGTVRFYVVYTVSVLFLTDWLLCLILSGVLYAVLRAHPQYHRFYNK